MIGWVVAACVAAQLVAGPQNPAPLQTAGPGTSEKALTIDGHLSLSGDILPVMDESELRPQVMVDAHGDGCLLNNLFGVGGIRYECRNVPEQFSFARQE